MPILNESSALVIYNDSNANSNPQFRFVDWRRSVQNWSVSNPLNEQFVIQPNSSQVIFSGARTTAIDNTTNFSISLNPVNSTVYRILATAGTAPSFRTDSGLDLTGDTVVVAVNNNATATITVTAQDFTNVNVGDQVWIPGIVTGDAALSSPFNTLNVGLWSVIGKASGGSPKVITLTRPNGVSFSGVSETVTPTATAQFVAFSSAGVQIGDTLEISAGFSPITQTAFKVANVTPSFVEVNSTVSYPLETDVFPDNAGMTFYLTNKQYLRVETDQEAVLRFNGDSGNSVRLSPRTVTDQNGVSVFVKTGTTWALEVVNRSRSAAMTVTVISAEK